jgi:hypothetical protein
MTEKATTEGETKKFDFSLDRSNLFLEETFTDLKVGTLKRFTPVLPDGSLDRSRRTVFLGQTSIHTPHGPLPLQNIIVAKDLAQAFKRFPEGHGRGHAAVDRGSRQGGAGTSLPVDSDSGIPNHRSLNPVGP